ncbi:hypothetical protein E3N88_33230 [Mikania micrantha]|uniref:Uncharacterized protein n=1 Tax=Mikania micrantha TaxID=192012 RepID=A0A5N6MAV4_9ASTR|nr:hypothetical protein E3N88_33230 [Mikania micrantha]
MDETPIDVSVGLSRTSSPVARKAPPLYLPPASYSLIWFHVVSLGSNQGTDGKLAREKSLMKDLQVVIMDLKCARKLTIYFMSIIEFIMDSSIPYVDKSDALHIDLQRDVAFCHKEFKAMIYCYACYS